MIKEYGMIRKNIELQFENYVQNYNLDDPNIHLKYIHSIQVAENCEKIAMSIGLNKDECDLAWMIGMLHDIGRFEQIRCFNTFIDKDSIDHAEFGADLLFKEGVIVEFLKEEGWYDLIEKAIRFHSRYRLPENLSEIEMCFCQILRDADKIDIYRANYETGLEVVYYVTKEELYNSTVTKAVYDTFLEKRAIPREIRKTVADNLVGHMALAFELVYPKSRILVQEQEYIWKLAAVEFRNPETKIIMQCVREYVRKYLQEKREL